MLKLQKTINKKSFAVKFELKEKRKKVAWVYLYVIFQDRHKEPYGLLENLYVEQEYRSHGLGKKLVKMVVQEAKKRKCYKIIGTSKMNKPEVHKFYEKLGFSKMGYEFRMDLRKSRPIQRD